ncbi:MAG TPA: MFS transporter [Steroidobacteraceae bacterium]|nr:MFS transporter [Steroidobacteraceae bacterium]
MHDIDNTTGGSIRTVAFASLVGTAIEWYDFYIYGTAAALIFPRLFFPDFTPAAGTLASFATFGVAFLARPIGGVVFGHFGDRIGRKAMLVTTLLLMGGATFLVGLLPTYAQAGLLAPVLLAVLRFVQGFAVGGEWGGATLMAVEHAPPHRRNFYASWPQVGSPLGLILSTAAFGLFAQLPEAQFLSWGWRVPFLLSFLLILVGAFVRLRVMESPAFERMRERGLRARVPLWELLRGERVTLLVATGVVLGAYNYIVTTFTPSFLVGHLGVARSVPLVALMLGGLASATGALTLAAVADRIGRRTVALTVMGVTALLAFPFFWLVDTARPALICLAIAAWMFANGAYLGILGILLAEMFPVRLRYSGISLAYQVAGIVGGGLAPLLAAALLAWSGGATWPLAGYLLVVALVSWLAIYRGAPDETAAASEAGRA